MRAKQSSTATATQSDPASDNVSQKPGGHLIRVFPRTSVRIESTQRSTQPFQRAARPTQPLPADLRGEGLLHDARNLVSAIGLYCDLLSMPGVLKPEHRQYPEELRLLGTRSRVLIEHLMRSIAGQNAGQNASHNLPCQNPSGQNLSDCDPLSSLSQPNGLYASPAGPPGSRIDASLPNSRAREPHPRPRPVSLRATVERCLGLLTRVANGRPIQVIYGPAADVPVCIGEEAVERILVNLVRNASQALDRVPHRSPEERSPEETDRPIGSDLVLRSHPPPASPPDHRPAIRITVGPLLDRLGAPRSWPFRHVRLIVQDFGCGMDPSQLHSMLSGPAAASRGTHGIGFRVVRELVASSNGDLRAASTPGAGTQVQIEWPVAATFPAENRAALSERDHAAGSTLASRAAAAPYRSVPPVSHAPQASQANTGAY